MGLTMNKTTIEEEEKRARFVAATLEAFEADLNLNMSGDCTPGSYFAITWGMHERSLLVFRLADEEPTLYADAIVRKAPPAPPLLLPEEILRKAVYDIYNLHHLKDAQLGALLRAKAEAMCPSRGKDAPLTPPERKQYEYLRAQAMGHVLLPADVDELLDLGARSKL